MFANLTIISMKTIQNNLRVYRKQKKLTQKQVAHYLGFTSIDRISKWENGLQYPHVTNLIKMAELLGCHAEELYQFAGGNNDSSV